MDDDWASLCGDFQRTGYVHMVASSFKKRPVFERNTSFNQNAFETLNCYKLPVFFGSRNLQVYSIRVRHTLLTYHTFITMYRYDSTSTFQSVLGTFNHILDTILRYLSVGVPIQPLKRCELTPFIFIEISTVQP